MDAKALAEVQQDHTRIDRETLIDKLKANLIAHETAHEHCLVGWRVAYIVALREAAGVLASIVAEFELEERMEPLDEGRWGGPKIFQLPGKPQSHATDYRNQIARLEMSEDTNMYVTHKDFAKFVLDDWSWSADFNESQTLYNNDNGG